MRVTTAFLLLALVLPAAAQSLTFVVTNDFDSGIGSLRQAIADANAQCQPRMTCLITFLTGGPIRPRTALPPIVTRSTGLTIEAPAARVLIDGSELTEGSGLEIRAMGSVTLRNLAIESFPGDGIAIVGGTHAGCRMHSMTVSRNRFRGLSVQAPDVLLEVTGSAVDGNGYSGIALWAARSAEIRGTSSSRNGASGVFVWNAWQVRIDRSVLNDNRQFGVCAVRSRSVLAFESEIRGNGVRNVDWELDGPTLRGVPGVPNAPEVLSARYDRATGITTVKGVLRSEPNTYGAIEVLVGAGQPEHDGTVAPMPGAPRRMIEFVNDVPRRPEIPFTFELRDALPGTWVSVWGLDYGNVYPDRGQITEVSGAVPVVE